MNNESLSIVSITEISIQTEEIAHPVTDLKKKTVGQNNQVTFSLTTVISSDDSIVTSDLYTNMGANIPITISACQQTVIARNPLICYDTDVLNPQQFKYWFIEMEYTVTLPPNQQIYLILDQVIMEPISGEDKRPRTKRGTVCIAQQTPFPDD